MSKDSIIFKGVPNGLLIMLNDELPFDELQKLFLTKVQNSKYLLEDASLLIKFKGRELSSQEEEALLNILLSESNVNIISNPTSSVSSNNSSVISNPERLDTLSDNIDHQNSNINNIIFDDDSSGSIDDVNINTNDNDIDININNSDSDSNFLESGSNFKNLKSFRPFKSNKQNNKTKTKITSKLKSKGKSTKNSKSEFDNNNLNIFSKLSIDSNNYNSNTKSITHFHKGNVRSGQSIEFEGTIVIIGDVNPGGKIIASGNIIVLGKLRGIVHAGCQGDDSCFISALHLHPAQLFISSVLTYFPTSFKREVVPEYAYLKDGKIYIEQL
ncbi:MAG: septum site-determining protein MinC [bacterium]